MSGFVFYDLECTGLSPAFDVPIQAAFIMTDDDLTVRDEIVLRARIPDHIVPSPEAMLVTGLTPQQLVEAPLSQTQMLQAITRLLATAAPATIIGYNNLRYDEEFLRQAFFQNLLPPYATSYDGHRRADVLTVVRAVAALEPSTLQVPEFNGRRSFGLQNICCANGIPLLPEEAHDALQDARATLALFRFIRRHAPDTVAAVMRNADRRAVTQLLDAGGVLGLLEFDHIIPVTPLASAPGNASSMAVADLSIDPAEYLDLAAEDLIKAMSARGHRPVRTVKINAQPVLLPWAQMGGVASGSPCDHVLYRDRIAQITAHDGIWKTLPVALANRFADHAPAPWPEAKLYEGFIARDDAQACRIWHELGWDDRVPHAHAHIGDDRLQAFAQRLTYLEAPHVLTADARLKTGDWLVNRLTTRKDVPWLTLPTAIAQCARLKASEANAPRRKQLDEIAAWLEQRLRSIQCRR